MTKNIEDMKNIENIISKLLHKKVILDSHCVNKLLATGFKDRNKLVYIIRIVFWDIVERLAMKLSDLVISVSAIEKKYIEDEYHIENSKVILVPHESDLEIAKYTDIDANALKGRLNIQNRKVIAFVGDLRAVQNYDAASFIVDELAPDVLKKRDDIVFLIIGKGQEYFVEDISPAVIFTGFVEDLGRYLSISDICIAPMRLGGGVKTKVLDYIKYNKNILTTSIGAQGIEDQLTKGRISKIEDFPDRLLELLGDKSENDSKC